VCVCNRNAWTQIIDPRHCCPNWTFPALGFVHLDGANCAFGDGHAKWVPKDAHYWINMTDYYYMDPTKYREGSSDPQFQDGELKPLGHRGMPFEIPHGSAPAIGEVAKLPVLAHLSLLEPRPQSRLAADVVDTERLDCQSQVLVGVHPAG